MPIAKILLLFLAAIGHVAVWTGLYNRFTARNFPRQVLRFGELLIVTLFVLLPFWSMSTAARWFSVGMASTETRHTVSNTYIWTAAVCGVLWSARKVWERQTSSRINVPTTSQVHRMQADKNEPLVHGWKTRTLALIPGNQLLQLDVNEKQLTVPQLDTALDGLRIIHFSDLHFTGGLTTAFYHEVIRHVNALEGDFIALTGDIVDTPKYLEWIEPLLSQLHAPHGVYFVLGNHDKKAGSVEGIRQRIERAGLISVGGRSLTIRLRDREVLLAGNERPWIEPAPDGLSAASALRIALLHTPDEIEWARRHRFQLVLAGHTHGGQICLPGIGALVSPSRYGTRYASGVFREPPTIMHVSRGISGCHTVRLRCRPEITRIVLRCG